ncbi:hypothetical protein [Roseicella sp. DB1501]|nr:hypothetical protein [Roseicella sp. DB1501]
MQIPCGTTAERPANPADGELFFNIDNAAIEVWYDGLWRYIPLGI